MRTLRAVLALATLPLLSGLFGCASAFPAGALDVGRGATPLERGATRVQVGGGGGVAPLTLTGGGGVGARVEHQFLDDLSVGADLGGGLQTVAGIAWTAPFGGYLDAQYNPLGVRWVAVRLRLGGGVDAPVPVPLGIPTGPSPAEQAPLLTPAPYVSALLQVPLSLQLDDAIEAYLAPGLGVKQFVGGEQSAARVSVSLGTLGLVNTVLFPSVTAGLRAAIAPQFSFYVSGNLTPAVLLGTSADTATGKSGSAVLISPSANVQTGLAYVF